MFAAAVATERICWCKSVFRGTRTGPVAVNRNGLAGFETRGQPWRILVT